MFYSYSFSLSGNLSSISVVVLLLLYTWYSTVRHRLRTISLLIAPILMIIRYLVASYLTTALIETVFLIDTITAIIYIGILYLDHQKLWVPVLFAIISTIINMIHLLVFFGRFPEFGWVDSIIYLYGIVVILFLAMSVVIAVRSRNLPGMVKLYLPMILGMLFATILGLVYLGQRLPFLVQNLLTPVSLGAFFFPIIFIAENRERRLRGTLQLQQQSLDGIFDFMRKIGSALGEHQSVDRILDFFVHTLAGYTQADGCAVFILNEMEDVLEVRSVVGFYPHPYPLSPDLEQAQFDVLEEHFRNTPIRVGEGHIGRTLSENRVYFSPELTDEERREIYGEYLTLGAVGSFISIPLTAGNRQFGVISIVRSSARPPFSDLNFSNAEIFSRYISLIIDNRNDYLQLMEKQQIEQEISIAAEIQKSLLPKDRSSKKNIAVMFSPLRGVSGDYYDIIHAEENTQLLICDIAGKGIPACLLMVLLRTALHLSIAQHGLEKLDKILLEINRAVLNASITDRFATMSLVTHVQKEHRLLYSNAGHIPLLLWKKQAAEVNKIDAGSLPIGIDQSFSAEIQEIPVEEGDFVLFCTDGILETRDRSGGEYTMERLMKIFEQKAPTSHTSQDLVNAIMADLQKFSGQVSAQDDQTLLVMQISG